MSDRPYIIALAAAIVVAFSLLAFALKGAADDRAVLKNQTRVLCDRGVIIADVIEGGIAVVQAERNDPTVSDATHRADDAFIARFQRDLIRIQEQTRVGGACHTGDARP